MLYLMSEKFSLKDALFNQQKVNYLAALITEAYPAFDAKNFTRQTLKSFPVLELKQRINCITQNLEKYLPNDFEHALDIILKSLPKELDPNKKDDDFGDFIFAPFSDFVAKNGLQDKYLKCSFNALAQITKRFSCEDAMRYFINKYPDESFTFMQTMSISNNYHQRRLASEGLRPKLPWCIGINFDYKKSINILNNLYFDNTRFVVRSVANHLNDITKIDADIVIKTLKKWQTEGRQTNQKELDFLIKHALRTLVKKGHAQALNLLGFHSSLNLKISHFHIKNSQINLGEKLDFCFEISSTKDEKLMIDYVITYPTKTKKISTKVFKIKQLKLLKNTSIYIQKKHLFKAMSTKKLYSGEYQIRLQINGKKLQSGEFCIKNR